MTDKTRAFILVDSTGSRLERIVTRIATNTVCAAVVFVPGLLADSAAMQWAGFVFYAAMALGTLVVFVSDHKTADEIRAELDKIEAGKR
jgi:hypothetical protein